MLGYHYERGLADGRNEPKLRDDISYVNHYVSVELNIHLTDRTHSALDLITNEITLRVVFLRIFTVMDMRISSKETWKFDMP
jgi:hypothetical protein